MKIGKIERDEACASSPRGNYNLGTLCLFHRSYLLPNEGKMSVEETQKHIFSEFFKGVYLPVWAYDHGTVHFKAGARVGCFADQWDSAQAGVIYVEREKIEEELYSDEPDVNVRVVQILSDEVEEFDAWQSGECYGYRIIDSETGEEEDSCWGFIGSDVAVDAATEAGAEKIEMVD
jgi:hypothetical protein